MSLLLKRHLDAVEHPLLVPSKNPCQFRLFLDKGTLRVCRIGDSCYRVVPYLLQDRVMQIVQFGS